MPVDRPIPAFYCCYLLRSTVRTSTVYVGSTPHPVRRLRQHNGLSKGGAFRTSKANLRPWDMTCIVTGFPSHIAALQFEWAWQNPHITLHIPPESRIQQAVDKKRSGHPKRPRHSVTSLLSNLHLLLRVPSFSRWPLEVRFFHEDVHKSWLKWCSKTAESIQSTIPIVQDFPPGTTEEEDSDSNKMLKGKKQKISHGIAALNVDYTQLKQFVVKTNDIIGFEREGSCAICHSDLDHDGGIYTICSSPGCESVTHMTCLSNHFLDGDEEDALVPIRGKCPICKAEMKWADVVKELSLRMRGQKEVEKLLKAKRVKKGTATASQAMVDSDDDESAAQALEDELETLRAFNPEGRLVDMDEGGWAEFDYSDSDLESMLSATSTLSRAKKAESKGTKRKVLPMVIEDSDWEDAIDLN